MPSFVSSRSALASRCFLPRQLLPGRGLSCVLLAFGLQLCRLCTDHFLTRRLLLRGLRPCPVLGDSLPRRLVDSGLRSRTYIL